MAKVLISENYLIETAEAIRERTNKTETIPLINFDDEISNISAGNNAVEGLLTGSLDEYTNNRVEKVGNGAFYMYRYPFSSHSPISLSLPSVYSIGSEAFSYCNVKELKFKRESLSLGEKAFTNSGLEYLYVAGKIEGSSNMFNNSNNLITIESPGTTSVVSYGFPNCSSLKNIIMPNLKSISYYGFKGCTSLERIYFPELTSVNQETFQSCSNLKIVHLPKLSSLNYQNIFASCTNLDTFILQNETEVISLNSSVFSGTQIANGEGAIYVPDSLVEDYKVATNWSKYADQIKKLSELDLYTVNIISSNNVINLLAKNKTVNVYCDYNHGINREDYIGIIWNIEGNGTIDENGTVTPTAEAKDGDILKITATSTYNDSLSDVIEIKIISKEPTYTISTGEEEEWIETNETINGNSIYKSNGYSLSAGAVRKTATIKISGYTSFTMYIKADSDDHAETILFFNPVVLSEYYGVLRTYGDEKGWVKFSKILDGEEHIINVMYYRNNPSGWGEPPDVGYFYITGEEE